MSGSEFFNVTSKYEAFTVEQLIERREQEIETFLLENHADPTKVTLVKYLISGGIDLLVLVPTVELQRFEALPAEIAKQRYPFIEFNSELRLI